MGKQTESNRELPLKPDKIGSYFKMERLPLTIVTVSGLIYNIGLSAGPWFEGQLAQCLWDIAGGKKALSAMLLLAAAYIIVIAVVQGMRFLKRFWVRRFANDVNRTMRHVLYNRMLFHADASDSVGTVITKAVSDVDACAEGMRKVTTELFDTGVALVTYLVMLLVYDWRLALISCAFTPPAYLLAEKIKTVVYRYTAAAKESAGRLNDATLESVDGAVSYRITGGAKRQSDTYEACLADYEKRSISANIWENLMPPLYQMITMLGVLPILYFGARNLTGTGFTVWNIAAFTAFLSCFSRMAIKASKAAKLFNAVQKARVSWRRLKGQLTVPEAIDRKTEREFSVPLPLTVNNLSFTYPDAEQPVFEHLSFSAKPGEIIGITGGISSGKSTVGKVFLCEAPFSGEIFIGDTPLDALTDYERSRTLSYLGHAPELMNDTIRENICLGKPDAARLADCLRAVCLDAEIAEMSNGVDTMIGSGGIRLSGGQRARLALARTLYHKTGLLILDDPFSAVDRTTEAQLLQNLKQAAPQAVILLITHRVYLFGQCDKVLYLQNGKGTFSDHETLRAQNADYAHLCSLQAIPEEGGAPHA